MEAPAFQCNNLGRNFLGLSPVVHFRFFLALISIPSSKSHHASNECERGRNWVKVVNIQFFPRPINYMLIYLSIYIYIYVYSLEWPSFRHHFVLNMNRLFLEVNPFEL